MTSPWCGTTRWQPVPLNPRTAWLVLLSWLVCSSFTAQATDCSYFNSKICSPPDPNQCNKPLDHNWGVYITPGFESGVNWGGYHATIAGFSRYQNCKKPIRDAIKSAWRTATSPHTVPLTFHFGNPRYVQKIFPIECEGIYCMVKFNSQDLVNFSRALVLPNGFDCQKMKGPLCEPGPNKLGPRWHLTLCTKSQTQKCNKNIATTNWNRIKDKTWFFYKVREPALLCKTEGLDCLKEGFWERVI